jgi:restriction endonuclease Mrr
MDRIPPISVLTEHTCHYLAKAGRRVSNAEIDQAVIASLGIPQELLEDVQSGNRTVFQYRMAWARTKAKSLGFAISPAKTYWESTPLNDQVIIRSNFPIN